MSGQLLSITWQVMELTADLDRPPGMLPDCRVIGLSTQAFDEELHHCPHTG